MKIENNAAERKTGKISFSGREIILYLLDMPHCDTDDDSLNWLFASTSENYLKYLEEFAEKNIIPELKSMIEGSKRSREIRNELGIPINATLNWKISSFKEKYISLRCESRLSYANGKKVFTVRALNFDTENMILKKAKHFSKKAVAKKDNFYIQGSKLCTFDRNFAVCENPDGKSEDMIKIRTYKIDRM